MSINETTLEMHFHNPLIKLFKETLGLGEGKLNFYKYSPQRECFVGFDQAYVRSELSDDQLFRQLRDSAMTDGYNLGNFFVGYFLQFKVVKEMQRRVRLTPPQITSRPHYRVSLDTKKNVNTGFSQHELLYSLNRNQGAMVYYACPMVFDKSELYVKDPSLDLLRLADINDCPDIYSDNESHYIYFDDAGSEPIWCSDPVEGKAYSPKTIFSRISDEIEKETAPEEQFKLLDALKDTEENIYSKKQVPILDLVSDSLVIVQYSGVENA